VYNEHAIYKSVHISIAEVGIICFKEFFIKARATVVLADGGVMHRRACNNIFHANLLVSLQ
jgi:hypothetical protein